jgi:hypothetical protein
MGIHAEEGPYLGGTLTLQIQSDRVDWILNAAAEQEMESIEPAVLGPFPDVLGAFVKPLAQWLTTSGAVNRLAFGAILMQPVAGRETGYEQLAAYLSQAVKIDPRGSSDFVYQINRPRTSGVEPNLRINRLSKWAVLLATTYRVAVTPRGVAGTTMVPSASACRLELDINTAPTGDGADLARDALPRLLNELVTLGQEIATRGDVP